MEVSVEEKGPFDREVTVRVPADQVSALFNQEISKLAASVRLPGFRPGKVPRKIIEQRYGDSVRAEVADQLFRSSYPQALTQESLRPIGTPELSVGELAQGEDFTYTASLQIFPSVEPTGYTDIALTKPMVEIEEGDVDKVVTQVQEANAVYSAVDGAEAAEGDRLKFDFEGFIDDEPFEGGKADDYELELGSKQFIPGFEEQLLGTKAGVDIDVKVPFPEDYHAKELAGKEATFKCKVKEVQQRSMPEVNDELAEKAGVPEGGVEALRKEIRSRLEREAEKASRNELKQQVFNALLEANKMDLPSQMIDQEIEAMVKIAKEEYKRQGVDPDQMGMSDETWRQQYDEKAKERVSLGLLMGAITSKESIQVDDAAVEAHLDEMIQQFAQGEYGEELKKHMRQDKDRMEELRGSVLEEKVIDWVIENGTLTEEKKSFAELVEPKA
uniref:Trigger factor n=1 Tax=Magnetococcus massalia (strain MO-1) TaxID=451514 RepID=A0A1S7LM68_MAGMO|nr:Trigger factor [Candidatus Magnetococcus massalia]